MNNHHDETHQFPITDSCKKAVIDKTLKLDKEAVRESAASPAATRQEVCSPASRILLCFSHLPSLSRIVRFGLVVPIERTSIAHCDSRSGPP